MDKCWFPRPSAPHPTCQVHSVTTKPLNCGENEESVLMELTTFRDPAVLDEVKKQSLILRRTLALGRWCRIPMSTLLIVSNANVGGPATAAAMASARRWQSLVRPAVLVGILGYTIGTAVGCLVGTQFLQPMLQASFLVSRI